MVKLTFKHRKSGESRVHFTIEESIKFDDVCKWNERMSEAVLYGFTLDQIEIEFCRFHPDDGTLEALREFLASADSLVTISLIKNQWSNDDMARVLQVAHNKELCLILPGGRLAQNNRHLVLKACQDRLETLTLNFKGGVSFAGLDQEVVNALELMKSLRSLTLDGFSVSDAIFANLAKVLKSLPLLKVLDLARLRSLTSASMREISKLGAARDEIFFSSRHDENSCIQELHIFMTPSLFSLNNSNDGRDEEGYFEDIFRDLSVRLVSIQECGLDETVIQAIFRGLAAQQCNGKLGISEFRMKGWKFGSNEFDQLKQSLPSMALTRLDIKQGGTELTPVRTGRIMEALFPNTSLTSFNFSFRSSDENGSTFFPWNRILKRNRCIQLVQTVMAQVPTERTIVDSLVLERLALSDPFDLEADAMYLLLKNRVLAAVMPRR